MLAVAWRALEISSNFSLMPVFSGKQQNQHIMKTNVLPIKAFLASLGAIALFPFTAAAAAAVFTVTGIFAVLAADYGRTIEPLRVSAEILPFGAPGQLAVPQSRAA
jgi:hypothetical protein